MNGWTIMGSLNGWPAEGGLEVLLILAAKGSLILAVAALSTVFMRRSSAAGRHLVWTLAFLGVLLLPLLEGAVPTWRALPRLIDLAPAPEAPQEPAAEVRFAEGMTVVSATREVGVGVGVDGFAPVAGVGSAATGVRSATAGASRSVQAEGPRGSRGPEGHGFVRSAAVPREPLNLAAVAIGLWLVGSVLALVSILVAHVRVRLLQVGAEKVQDPEWQHALLDARRSLNLRRNVTLLSSGESTMPMTWGTFRPRVLIPATASAWDPALRRQVLLHELAHVKRGDYATQLAAEVVCALHWFNPFAWLGVSRLRIERERASDDRVLRAGNRPSDYAQSLLNVARALRSSPLEGVGAVAMARPSKLRDRLQAILDPGKGRTQVSRRVGALAGLFTIGLVLPLAALGFEPEGGADLAEERVGEVLQVPVPLYLPVPEPLNVPAPDLFEPEAVDVSPRMPATLIAAGDVTGPEVTAQYLLTSTTGFDLPELGIGTGFPVQEVCRFEENGSHSSNIHSDDGGELEASWSTGNCSVEITIRGDVRFNEEESDIVSMSRNGYLEIEERIGRDRRRLEVEQGNDGSLEWSYWEGRTRVPFETDERRWFAALIPEIFRHTGLLAEERVARILSRAGVGGVLDEVSQIESDWVASTYLGLLMRDGELSPQEVDEVLSAAGRRIESDYSLAELLLKAVESGDLRRETQASYLEAAETIESDYELRRVLHALLDQRGLSDELVAGVLETAAYGLDSDYEMAELLIESSRARELGSDSREIFVAALGSIDSDYEVRRVVSTFVQQGNLTNEEVVRILELGYSIDSDYEKAELLIELSTAAAPLPAETRSEFFRAVREIDSSWEQKRVLDHLLEMGPASEDDLDAILDMAVRIDGEHETMELLLRLAREYELEGAALASFVQATASLDGGWALGQVLQALLEEDPENDDVVIAVLKLARNLDGDYERSELLLRVARDYRLEGAIEDAFMEAADEISSEWEQDRVFAAMVRNRRGR